MKIRLADKNFVETCSPTEVTAEEAKELLENIVPQMKNLIKDIGVGLAGPQIGIAKKFFIAKDINTGEFDTYFNARYVKNNDGRIRQEEGCLTYPEKGERVVKRLKSIKLIYQQLEKGELVDKTKKIKGEQAVIFQHECDHIGNGVNMPKTIFMNRR